MNGKDYMATKTKIKISDDIELRKILDEEYEKSCYQSGIWCEWKLAKGKCPYAWCKAGFKIHQLAKSSQDIVTQTALRVVGQAVATGHMREHAMVSSDYAVKVINVLFPDDINAVRQERLWQIERLKSIEEEI